MRIHNWIDYRVFQVARLMKQLVAAIKGIILWTVRAL
jgi:hypothetical protein